MALTTSVNATMLVPSRLAIMVARDRLAPRWLGSIAPATGTPIIGLTLTLAASSLLLISGQISLALNVAVFALVLLYFIHSFALLVLPRANPRLFESVTVRLAPRVRRSAAVISLLAMGGLIVLQIVEDADTLRRLSFAQRISQHALTTLELCAMWAAVGLAIYALGRRRGSRERYDYQAALARSHASDV
jgi:amino acid transporter